jgi:phytanoyl-CoA hydroxylase
MGGVVEPPAGLYTVGAMASLLPRLADVRAAEYAFYAHDGYLAVAQALQQAELESALAGLSALIENPDADGYQVQFEGGREAAKGLTGDARLDAVRKLMMFVDHDERLRAIAEHRGLLAIVERMLGGPAQLIQDMALIKPPHGGREKPWHQDKAYFDYPVGTPVVGIWIALDAATVENGCMHVFPGSQRAGPAPHFMVRDWQLCDANVEGLPCTAVALPPGGALFFDGLLHHGTPPNGSGSRRRALQFHYAAVGAERIGSEERLKLFGADGRDAAC